MKIGLVGCGFLGSLFAEEMAKRCFAFDEVAEWVLIDFDKVEERNAANQNFTVEHASLSKASTVGDVVGQYNQGDVTSWNVRLDKSNVDKLLDGCDVIVSAVDNLPTRELLWYYARANRVPLLHLGVSQQGTGNIEWTVGRYDTWSMNPLATLGQKRKMESAENIPRELKPCELIAFRGLGLNVSIAAAKALGLYLGFDPEKVATEHLGVDVLPRTASTWRATNTGHELVSIVELTDAHVLGAEMAHV